MDPPVPVVIFVCYLLSVRLRLYVSLWSALLARIFHLLSFDSYVVDNN